MIVAESAIAAQDAAELVAVDYEPLTPVTDARAALAPDAPQVWPQAPGNLAVDWPGPAADPEANARQVDAIFAGAKFVARIAVMNQRMAVASMEPRGATASYDAAQRQLHAARLLARRHAPCATRSPPSCSMPKDRLRVLTDDVGGAFGLKTGAYPEYIAQMVGAKKFGRPIHWMSGRSEAFLSDNQARDIYSEAELALDEKGRFLALRIRNTGNLGAYVGPVGANIPTLNFTRCLPGIVRHQAYRRQRALRFHQHDRRPRPIAAPGGRKRTTCSSAWSKKPRASPASIRQSCGGAISFPLPPCRTRPRSAPPMTAAISRRSSTRRWRWPTMTASKRGAAKPRNAANIAALGFPACWSIPAGRRSKVRCSRFRATARSRSISMCSRPAKATLRCFLR